MTASLYATAVGVANSELVTALAAVGCSCVESYEIATPVLTKTKPLLESVDGLAVAT